MRKLNKEEEWSENFFIFFNSLTTSVSHYTETSHHFDFDLFYSMSLVNYLNKCYTHLFTNSKWLPSRKHLLKVISKNTRLKYLMQCWMCLKLTMKTPGRCRLTPDCFLWLKLRTYSNQYLVSQPAFTCSKSTTETSEQCVKSVQS